MENSKEYILKTAYLLFLKKSYKAVTIQELMDKTNLTKGAFYHHYKSKEQIFEEIINSYFKNFTHVDFSAFSKTSLYDFIQDHINYNLKTGAELSKLTEGKGTNSNHYYLIFEALKILPDFKANALKQMETELQAWISVIKTAKEKGEIQSKLSPAQLAQLFINVSDGTALKTIIQNDIALMNDTIADKWNDLYTLLQA